jgi:Tfp pilus assembly protein PilN
VKHMEIKLNLSSKPYLNRQNVRLWILFACTLMVLLLIFNGLHGYQNYRQLGLLENLFEDLQAQVANIPGAPVSYSLENHAAVRAKVAQANEMAVADQFRWTTLLSRFEELIPGGVSLRSIRPNFKERSVQIACVARDLSSMTQFVDNLLGSDDLNQAYLKNHAEVESQLNGGSQMQIGFSLQIREAF